MIQILKAWLAAVFVSPKVRFAFWGMVGVVLTVQLPTVPEVQMPEWLKLLVQLGVGTLIPWVTELVKQKATEPIEQKAGK